MKIKLLTIILVIFSCSILFIFAEEAKKQDNPQTETKVKTETSTNKQEIPVTAEAPDKTEAPAKTEAPTKKETTTEKKETGPSIISINFEGNNTINSDALSSIISVKVGDSWDTARIQGDINNIASMGVFSAVTYKKEERPGGIALTFNLIENPILQKITITGSDPLSIEEVESVITSKTGMLFNEVTIKKDFNSIKELYQSKGYYAYVTEDADLNPETGELTVPIHVFKVGKITISGNKKTKDYVILREMTLKPGDYYNVITLRNKDYPRIYDLGYFETINEPEQEEDENGDIIINIPVVEKNTGSFNVGLGYSSSKKLVGTLKVSDTNFMGTGKSVGALWEQGTRSGFNGKYSWEVYYTDPWIDKKNTSMSISVYNKLVYRFTSGAFGGSSLDNDVDYGERHQGTQITFSRPFGKEKNRTAMIGFKYDNVETNPNLLAGKDDMWKIMQNGIITAVSASIDHDTRDLKSNPKNGDYKSLSAEAGHVKGNQYAPSLVDHTYYKTGLDGNYAKGIAEYRVFKATRKKKEQESISSKDLRPSFAFRLRGGVSGGEVPFFEQFFVGGTDTLRGYDDDRFWGKYLLASSLEYRHPIFDYLTLVAFFDYADAWGANEKFVNFNDLTQSKNFQGHPGYGIGGRFNTPLGAMSLDWGFGDEGNKLHFSMGHTF